MVTTLTIKEHILTPCVGFPLAACRKAVYLTAGNGLEAATEWVMLHMGDDDFATEDPSWTGYGGGVWTEAAGDADAGMQPQAVLDLVSMGFTEKQAKYALRTNNHDANLAAEWLFTGGVDTIPPDAEEPMDTAAAVVGGEGTSRERKFDDGNGEYKLIGFISHMGSNTHCGHFLCHLFKDNRWVLFNDEKVALSQSPPIGLGYLYLFERVQ